MESVSDVLNSVKATLYERLSNPLLSTFIISWIIWNYKFVMVILSSSIDVIEKIDYIKFDLIPFTYSPFFTFSNLCTALYLFIGPIVTSLLYLYVIYPRLGKIVYEDHSEHKREYQDIKVNIDGKTLMSDEDVRAIKSKLRTIESIHSKQLDSKVSEIELLKSDLENMTKDAAKSRTQLSEIQAQHIKLDEIQSELFKLTEENKQKEEKIQKIERENLSMNDKLKYFNDNPLHSIPPKPEKEATKKLTDEAAQLLKIISHSTSWQNINILRSNYDIHRLRFNESIETLINNGYIESNDVNQVMLTDKGGKYLLDNDLI